MIDTASSYQLSHLWLIPFLLMLGAIAVLPITAYHWWDQNKNKFAVSLCLGIPVLIYFVFFFPGGTSEVIHTGIEYFSFIVLLTSLFVVSAGIYVGGDFKALPITNAAFLFIGSLLASFMGTTGASMVLIRPLLRTNAERKHIAHTVVFFILLVGNIGGCLTPLGDPPLFMGYLAGVPFTWTFSLWPEWLFCVVALCLVYLLIDSYWVKKEAASGLPHNISPQPIHIVGKLNLLALAGIILCVAFVPTTPLREILLLVISGLSWYFTDEMLRHKNRFTWHPIIEVAALFLGVFATMIPALHMLRVEGQSLGISSPVQFFWATGLLSAFLDNTPTYVVFFNLAQSLGLNREVAGMPQLILRAISLGAVFFGALTYIGNAPNFMIKAIAEKRGIKMPSFFSYLAYSAAILLPLFTVLTMIWMR